MTEDGITRRRLFALLKDPPAPALPKALPGLVTQEAVYIHRAPEGLSCARWSDHMRRAGFIVKTKETNDLNMIKERLGVPSDLAACHTAELADYVIEGHVPASAVKRLFAEKPKARGLAVAGMPAGAPGVECLDEDPYEVVIFGTNYREVYMKFIGTRVIS
jgi:hypothetical protein